MSPLVFALKRVIQRPLFVMMLVAYVFAVSLAGTVGGEVALPAAGVFDASGSEESQRIVSYLIGNGFVPCESSEDMIELVRSGKLDCGVILPENLVSRMAKNDLDGCVPWIVLPTSFVPDLYRNHVAVALFREYTPYITATLFEDTVVPQEDVFLEYEKMFESGYVFSFDDTVIDSTLAAGELQQRSLVMGVSAILLCVVVFAFCADIVGASFQETVNRIGLSKAIAMTVIPGLLVRTALAACAGCIGLCLTKAQELIVPLLIYTVLLAGIGTMLSGLLRNVRLIYTLLSVLVIGSIALCPIYTDVALTSPALAVIRYIFPPYWLWLLPGHRFLGAIAALAAQLGGLLVLVIRYSTAGKYCLHLRNKSRQPCGCAK